MIALSSSNIPACHCTDRQIILQQFIISQVTPSQPISVTYGIKDKLGEA